MTAITSYGSWNNNVSEHSTGPEQDIRDLIGGGDPDWVEKFPVDAAVEEYRDAINAKLPSGVTLTGDEFIGPYYDADRTWDPSLNSPETGALDIKTIVESVDLAAIVERHDPDA